MPEYLMPTPISYLKKLLNCYAKGPEKWDETMASIDLMIDMDKGKLKPYRYYAKRWKWSISTVHKYLPELKERVKCMRSFDTQDEQAANMREQNTQLREQKPLFRTPKTHKRERSEFLRERSANSTIQITDNNTNINHINNNQPSAIRERVTRAREGSKPRFKKPTIKQLAETFEARKTTTGLSFDPKAEAEKFFNHYESNGWRVGKNPMKSWPHAVTNWVTRIKERTYGNSHDARADGRSAGHVHDPKAGTGRGMPASIHPRAPGATRPNERPGSYSKIEWLRKAGYTDEEIFGDPEIADPESIITPNPASHQINGTKGSC